MFSWYHKIPMIFKFLYLGIYTKKSRVLID